MQASESAGGQRASCIEVRNMWSKLHLFLMDGLKKTLLCNISLSIAYID